MVVNLVLGLGLGSFPPLLYTNKPITANELTLTLGK